MRAPEGNGCIERLIRTLKEQLLWLRPFRNVEVLAITRIRVNLERRPSAIAAPR